MPVQAASAAIAPAQTFEPLGRIVERAWSMVGRGSTGGPSESARRAARAGVLARALDESGDCLTEVRLEGGDPYEFTAAILAWGAARAAEGELQASGALGPAEAFDLYELHSGAEEAGMRPA